MANSYIRASTELTLKLGSCILASSIYRKCFFAAYISLCRDAVSFGNLHVCACAVNQLVKSNPVSAQVYNKIFTPSEINQI